MPLSPLHPPACQIPAPFCNDPGFIQDWSDWLTMRKERRHPISPMICTRALRQLAGFGGIPEARASLNHCIAAGYQGLFPAPGGAHGGAGVPPASSRNSSAIGHRQSVIATPQELNALADYKRQAALIPPRDRGDLLAKARDTLPKALADQLADYIWKLGRP